MKDDACVFTRIERCTFCYVVYVANHASIRAESVSMSSAIGGGVTVDVADAADTLSF